MDLSHLVLLVGEDNTYLRERGQRVELQEGVFEPGALDVEHGATVETHLGEEFTALEPRFPDVVDGYLEQRTQTPTTEDLGYVTNRTGLCSTDVVVDAGTGSAHAALAFANVAREVHTYENRDDHVEVARRNLDRVRADAVELHERDVKHDGFTEKADVAFLDMKHPEEALDAVDDALRPGGYLAVYSPVYEQVHDVTEELRRTQLTYVETTELSRREWRPYPTRPRQHQPHSAFIVIARKMNE